MKVLRREILFVGSFLLLLFALDHLTESYLAIVFSVGYLMSGIWLISFIDFKGKGYVCKFERGSVVRVKGKDGKKYLTHLAILFVFLECLIIYFI